jgi:hypothetical protein
LAENANVHARDNQGRGALHLCVLFSQVAGTSFLDVCKGPLSAINSGFCAGHPTTGISAQVEMSTHSTITAFVRKCSIVTNAMIVLMNKLMWTMLATRKMTADAIGAVKIAGVDTKI